jgi:hypothetical protein
MKKIALLMGAALIMGATTYACDGHKEKGKKEACCSKDKKETADKGHACCKKGDGKTATASDAKKAPTKETKNTAGTKKS